MEVSIAFFIRHVDQISERRSPPFDKIECCASLQRHALCGKSLGWAMAIGANRLNPEELTDGQRKLFRQVTDLIDRMAQPLSVSPMPQTAARLQLEHPHRPHNVIVINGDRGCGKTTLLLSLHGEFAKRSGCRTCGAVLTGAAPICTACGKAMDTPRARSDEPPPRGAWKSCAYPLPVIYPEFREAGDYSLMEDVFVYLETAIRDEEEFAKALEVKSGLKTLRTDLRKKVWSGWTFAQPLGQDTLSRDSITFDDFVHKRSNAMVDSRKRQAVWRSLVDNFLDKVGAEVLVVMIDDSDLQPDVARDVSQSLRLYLNHPRIVTILCVHWESFRENVLRTEMTADREYWRTLTAIEDTELRRAEDLRNRGKPDAVSPRLVGPAFDRQTEQLDQYLDKILPNPYRQALPERLEDSDVCRLLLGHRNHVAPPGPANISLGMLGLWLWRTIHRETFQNLTPRALVYMRDAGGKADAVKTGNWSPAEAMASIPGIGDDQGKLNVLAGGLSPKGQIADAVIAFPDAGGLNVRIGSGDSAVAFRTGGAQRAARYLFDLSIATDTAPKGARRIQIGATVTPVPAMAWEAYRNGSPLADYGVPANAFYLPDMEGIDLFPPAKDDGDKLLLLTLLQAKVALGEMFAEREKFIADISAPLPAMDLQRIPLRQRALVTFRSLILLNLFKSRKIPDASYQNLVRALADGLAERSWEMLQGREDWTEEEDKFLSTALKSYSADPQSPRMVLANAIKVARSYLHEAPPSPSANPMDGLLVLLGAEVLSQSSWRNRILLTHAVSGPLTSLVEMERFSPTFAKMLYKALDGALSAPATDEDRFSALDLVYAHHRFAGEKGTDPYADILAVARESVTGFGKAIDNLVHPPMKKGRQLSVGQDRSLLPFQGLREWSGLSLSALRALQRHVA